MTDTLMLEAIEKAETLGHEMGPFLPASSPNTGLAFRSSCKTCGAEIDYYTTNLPGEQHVGGDALFKPCPACSSNEKWIRYFAYFAKK